MNDRTAPSLRDPARVAASAPVIRYLFVMLGLLGTISFTSTLSAQTSGHIAQDAPIVNFRLPTFTPQGFREWLVRGSEARLHSATEVEVRELTLTIFSGDAQDRIETMLLSPEAKIRTDSQIASGPGSIRVLTDTLEATGEQWTYDHREKRVTMQKNVRVTFRAQLTNLLQ